MKKLLMIGLFLMGMAAPLKAIPNQINYQGTLKQKGVPVTGTRNMRFRFVDASGADIPGTAPINMANVSVTQGLFAVQLTLAQAVDWQSYSPFIEVSIEGQVLGPNQPLSSNLYSIVAQTVSNGAITPAKIAPNYGLVPSGAIMMFANACPSGWSIFTGLQGHFPIGADPNDPQFSIGQMGGSKTHNHAVSGDGAHSHNVSSIKTVPTSDSQGSWVLQSNPTGWSPLFPGESTSLSGDHSHGGATGTSSSLPPFVSINYCQKQ
ncbi:MAG: hypothetical protein WC859_08535 [Elusimicrobiota bacterium]|jgi:hypothetical protein